jgi:hypothetical protein
MSADEGWSVVGGTLVAAGLGALIANFAAEWVKGLVRKGQAIESARDEDLGLIHRMVEELQEISTSYWSSSGLQLGDKEPQLRAQIVARLQHINELVAALFTGPPKHECDVLLISVMDSVGGGDFGEPDRSAAPERLTAIYKNCLSFAHLARQQRRLLKRGLLS